MSSVIPPKTSASSADLRRIFDTVKTPITLLALLGILVIGAWYGYKAVTAPAPTDPPVPCHSIGAGVLKSNQVTVTVLNGGTKRGLARDVAANLRNKGFVTRPSRNSEERVGQTIVKGARADAPEVMLVAAFFKQPKVVADNRIDGTVDVLVGNEYTGMNMDAPVQVNVPHGACVAATATPSASPAVSTPAPTPSR